MPLPNEAGRAAEDEVFGAFGPRRHTRREILVLLNSRGGELPSGYLAKHFMHSWPTTTRHLRVLEEAGLVSVRRTGRSSIYRLERERLRAVVRDWFALFAPYDPTQSWTPTGPRSTGR